MCGCGKKKTQTEASMTTKSMMRSGASESDILTTATNSDDFIYAIYNGPKYPHYLPSPTGVISQYGILNYGMGKKGDKIKVHKLDFEKSNGRLFLPLPEGEDDMANNGNEGIRGPEPIDENVFIAEYENNKRINAEAEKAAKAEAAKVEEVNKVEAVDETETNKTAAKKTRSTRTKKSEQKAEEKVEEKPDDSGDEPDNETQRVNWNS